jgi:ATP-binding cassette subfamily F protein 3
LEINLALRSWERSGDIVLRSKNLVVGYPEHPLFTAPDLELRRLECAALIGANGIGKTTFLKTILGRISPLSGEVSLGSSLRIGYFAQAHEDLHGDFTLFQEIEAAAPTMLHEQIRKYLGRYLFSGDEVFKPVKSLSGGERGRLALAKLALENANLLLLDEPTNHLDIPAQEILQSVLSEFQGTILLVSHDRYLINQLATQIWEIKADESNNRQGYFDVFRGTYAEYREMEVRKDQAISLEQRSSTISIPTGGSLKTEKNRLQTQQRRRTARLDELENEIAVLEAQVNDLTVQLENPPLDYAEVHRLGESFMQSQQALDVLYAEWEILSNEN